MSIFLLSNEYGYQKLDAEILPLNLLIPFNEYSHLNDNNFAKTPNISGQCIYNTEKINEAFELRGIDFNNVTVAKSGLSLKTLIDFRCWGRYIGSNFSQFSPLDTLNESDLEVYYVSTPNPLIYLFIFVISYLILVKYSSPLFSITKKILKNFYFHCFVLFFFLEFEYFINSAFISSYSFIALVVYFLFALILFKTLKNQNKDTLLYPIFAIILLVYLIHEANIELFNFYLESDYFISFKGILALQSTYEQNLFNHNYFVEEMGGGQRLVGQFANNYLPRILIFQLVTNPDLANLFYTLIHYVIAYLFFYFACKRYLKSNFASFLTTSLYLLSNISILWTQLSHTPPTILSFSILLLSITYLREKEFTKFNILSSIGFLILFQVSNIQFFVYVVGIALILILATCREKQFGYSRFLKSLLPLLVAAPFGIKPIKLYFETSSFSARIPYEVNPEKFVMTFENFQSLFRFDLYGNYFIEGNSDLYFSFLAPFLFLILKKRNRSDNQIKFLFYAVCFFVFTSTALLVYNLSSLNYIFSLVSNYQRIWLFGIFFLILLMAKIVQNETTNYFYRSIFIAFLLTVSTAVRIEYYIISGTDNFYTSSFGISVDQIREKEEELKSIIYQNNDKNYRWAGMCSKPGSFGYFDYIPNKGLLAYNTRWFDLYDSWSSNRYKQYFLGYTSIDTQGGKRYHHYGDDEANLEFLSEANVKQIIATKPCDIFLSSKQVVRIDESESFLVYELKRSKELVNFVENPIQLPLSDEFSKIEEYITKNDVVQSNHNLDLKNISPNDKFKKLSSEKSEYLFEVEVLNKNILSLRISYDPRWKVYVNGVEKDIVHVDYLFMGVELDSDSKLVLFEFNDSIIR